MPFVPLPLAEVNTFDRAAFVALLGGVFEGTPQLAERAWEARPFASWEALAVALQRAMERLSEDERIALIRAHPDLAGRAAIRGELTPESAREQASAGLDRLTLTQFMHLTALNAAYRERFSFPFVICVREHTPESILASFERRIEHAPEQEIATALTEIVKIMRLRLMELVKG
jgi:OHCU decarboxylase